jgi:hypothetical protein
VQAGGVEKSKFCLFLVVFHVRCISSVCPRFYFRGHALCFLPLAAILESSTRWYLNCNNNENVRKGDNDSDVWASSYQIKLILCTTRQWEYEFPLMNFNLRILHSVTIVTPKHICNNCICEDIEKGTHPLNLILFASNSNRISVILWNFSCLKKICTYSN